MSDTLKRDEISNYNPGAVTAPADFDPNAAAYKPAPPGTHLMEFTDAYEMSSAPKELRDRKTGATCSLYQLRPKLRVVAGQPHAGAGIMDFIHLPTQGQTMLTWTANAWGNFMRAFGFPLANNPLWPPGFQLDHLIGKRALVTVEQQLDSDRNPKFKDNGEPLYGVKMFGYEPPTPGWQPSNGTPAASPPTRSAPTPPAPAPVTAGAVYDL